MVIAVDAAGGDHYPEVPVKGAIEALKDDKSLKVLLIGPEEIIKKELKNYSYNKEQVDILHAPEIVGMDESPSQAIKNKRNSSITIGISAHKEKKCDAFVSTGNTGALLAASTLILGKLEGVMRPTIAATFPTTKGIRLLLDAGANLELKPEMYVQFAKMGTIFLRDILNVDNPTVGLLNIGEETEKGTEEVKNAYKALSVLPNFKGNIEGKDIFFAKTDLFVTDGFTGNIILKFGESIPETLKQMLGITIQSEDISEEVQQAVFTLLKKSLHAFNYEHVGGVPFLGVNGTSFVGHGGSSAYAVKNMIFSAVSCVKNELNKKIIYSLSHS